MKVGCTDVKVQMLVGIGTYFIEVVAEYSGCVTNSRYGPNVLLSLNSRFLPMCFICLKNI